MTATLNLVFPEWASSGNPRLHSATRFLADAVFGSAPVTLVDVPEAASLDPRDAVRGLDAIAAGCARALSMLRAAGRDRVFTIAGTCGAELAPVWYLNERYSGDLAVVWFDAHADLNTPHSSPSGKFHGMVLRTLLGEGPAMLLANTTQYLAPRQVVLAGTRDWDPDESAYVRRHGVRTVAELSRASIEQTIAAIRAAGFSRVYVHIDVDVINPASFGDVLMPTAGGPTLDDLAAALLPFAASCDVVGTSIVEYLGESEASRQQLVDLLSRTGLFDAYKADDIDEG